MLPDTHELENFEVYLVERAHERTACDYSVYVGLSRLFKLEAERRDGSTGRNIRRLKDTYHMRRAVLCCSEIARDSSVDPAGA